MTMLGLTRCLRWAQVGAAVGLALLSTGPAFSLPQASSADSTSSSSSKPASSSHSSGTHSAGTHSAGTHASDTHSSTKSHVSGKSAVHKSSTAGARSSSGKKGSRRVTKSAKSKKRGQQIIDSGRATQIQQALIREHYLQGEPSGSWDSATQAAMQRYQEDQGWQSKTIPDSRALIKLGLGPSHDHLLNPESAMTSSPGGPKPSDTKAGPKPTATPSPQQ